MSSPSVLLLLREMTWFLYSPSQAQANSQAVKMTVPKAMAGIIGKLAIGSIICGISCIGIFALINAVKAQERSPRDPERAQVYSHKAWRLSLIAIATWVVLLILIPVLMALVSYLLTLID